MQNGQTVRVMIDGKPRKITVAAVLYDEDDRQDQVGQGRFAKDANRWNELLILRTSRGAVAIRGSWVTRWQGESDRIAWGLAADDEGAARILAAAAAGQESEEGLGIGADLARHALKTLGWFDLVAVEA